MSNPLPDAVDVAQVRRALVVKLRHHGDVLLTSPVFTALKRAAPHATLDALVYRETAPMLANHPHIDQLHTIDRHWKRAGIATQVSAEWRLLRDLARRGYDLVVHLTEHPRGATLTRLLRPRHSVARERPEAGRWWSRTFTHLYRGPRGRPRHTVEQHLDALRRIGIQPRHEDRRLLLVPGAAAEQRVAALLAGRGVTPARFIQCHPGSRWLFKCWPSASSARLVERLVGAGHTVVLTGAPDERERALVAEILAATAPPAREHVVDLTGELDLSELAAVTSRARAFVGVDSAPMHIAAAMGTPCVALFGPSGDQEWGPWMVPHRVIVAPGFPCRPCGIDGCGGGKVSECLTAIPVDAVVTAIDELLRAGDAPQ